MSHRETGDRGNGSGERGEAAAYRAIFESAPDGIVVVDRNGVIKEMNGAAEELFGYDRHELRGRAVEMLVPESSRDTHVREREGYVEDPEPRPMGIGRELKARRKDGSVLPVEISLSPMELGGDLHVIATVRDVRQRQRLREFGMGALKATEEERQRIARELHDDTAQRLASMLLRLRVARNRAEGEEGELLEDLREEVAEIAEGVRRIARGLRPPALEEAGVETAIRSHVREVVGDADVDGEIRVDAVGQALTGEQQLALYRIVQEALSNTVRHAEADTVRVEVWLEDGLVRGVVEDDGKGFEVSGPPELQGGRGLGVLGMHERAHGVGGELTVESEPGEGTRVEVRLPAREPAGV